MAHLIGFRKLQLDGLSSLGLCMPLNWKKFRFWLGESGPGIKTVLDSVTIVSSEMLSLFDDTNNDIVGRLRHDDC
jgi:hypothetical protein